MTRVRRTDHMLAVEGDMQWIDKIPFIQFPAEWRVQMIPPFAGAVVRFVVQKENNIKVSVYLDCYEALGLFGEPHWEIYPGPSGENERFAMNDVDEMIEAIRKTKETL